MPKITPLNLGDVLIRNKKLVWGSVSFVGTGSKTFSELASIDFAWAIVADSGAAIPTRTVSITSISGNTVNLVVTEHAASANSVPSTGSSTVLVLAIGDPVA